MTQTDTKSIEVLSLCDGMSCGQIALIEAGIKYDKYYASEIDKFAIRQTQLNFPETVQLGDIQAWREWDIEWKNINLVLAGTPCTGFSFAGKGLAFNDPQSRLFFCFAEILEHIRKQNPNVFFLFENVRMKKEHLCIISENLGVFPVMIDSALVSAQVRKRYYWTNIRTAKRAPLSGLYSDIPQPEDKHIMLRDILEDSVDEKYCVSDAVLKRLSHAHKNFAPRICPEKTGTITPRNNSGEMAFSYSTTFIQVNKQGVFRKCQDKAPCLTGGGHSGGNHSDMALMLQLGRGKNNGGLHDSKSPTVLSNSWEQNNFVVQLNESKESNNRQPYQQNRVYDINYKSPALMAQMSSLSHAILESFVRRLTPTECSRLQTVPAWYRWECSDTQIYKMIGNGWTIEVIKHILSYLPKIIIKR
jgi:DNA (cytosine-5)-methyltransferase 3A